MPRQREQIRRLMLDGEWRTLREISQALKFPEASVSAQLRHLRKRKNGSYRVSKQRTWLDRPGYIMWTYRVQRAA